MNYNLSKTSCTKNHPQHFKMATVILALISLQINIGGDAGQLFGHFVVTRSYHTTIHQVQWSS